MTKCFLKIMHGRRDRFESEMWYKSGKKGFSKRILLRKEFFDFFKNKTIFEEAQKEDWYNKIKIRNNEESRKTENIGQTMKNDDARRKTHEKNFREREGSKKKKDIFVFFSGKKKAETEMRNIG